MKQEVEYLVIHCTATLEGKEVTSNQIRQWHLTPVEKGGRGWKQVGYEGMFHLNGEWEQLVKNNDDNFVDPWEVTNGAKGFNMKARHWVYVGGTDVIGEHKDTRTIAQREAMRKKVLMFKAKFPNVKIIGHNEISSKDCPSFDVQAWLKEIDVV